MASAVEEVHRHDFVHLDIKPSNFFISGGLAVKLGDFGLSQDLGGQFLLDVEGDSIYMAPELLRGGLDGDKQKINKKVDIFSLGASLLEMASGMNLPKNGVGWQKLREATI